MEHANYTCMYEFQSRFFYKVFISIIFSPIIFFDKNFNPVILESFIFNIWILILITLAFVCSIIIKIYYLIFNKKLDINFFIYHKIGTNDGSFYKKILDTYIHDESFS